MKSRRWDFAILLLLILVWFGTAVFCWWASNSWPRLKGMDPSVPQIHVMPGHTEDLRSSIPWFFVVLAASVLSAGFIEIAKLRFVAASSIARYLLASAMQLLIVLDVIRICARDWWTFLLILLGLSEYHQGRLDETVPLSWVGFPVASLVPLLVLVVFILRGSGSTVHSSTRPAEVDSEV